MCSRLVFIWSLSRTFCVNDMSLFNNVTNMAGCYSTHQLEGAYHHTNKCTATVAVSVSHIFSCSLALSLFYQICLLFVACVVSLVFGFDTCVRQRLRRFHSLLLYLSAIRNGKRVSIAILFGSLMSFRQKPRLLSSSARVHVSCVCVCVRVRVCVGFECGFLHTIYVLNIVWHIK